MGEYYLPPGVNLYDGWLPQNAGLPNTDATSVRFGMDASPYPATQLTSGVTVAGSVAKGGWNNYYFVVPSGAVRLKLELYMDDGTFDDNLYIKYNAPPTYTYYDFRPYLGAGAAEIVNITGSSTPPLTAGTWYISVNGYSAGTTYFHLVATLMSTATLKADPTRATAQVSKMTPVPLPAPENLPPPASVSENLPGPLAPVSSTLWGTVNRSGVYMGTQTSTLAPVPEAIVWTWEARNGVAPTALDTTLNTQTVIQLCDGTLLAGQAGALWQSPTPDQGHTSWYNVRTSLQSQSFPSLPSSPNVKDFLVAPNCDTLIAVNGTVGTGGVWLSGDDGVDWMNISSGFDSSSQMLESLVHQDPLYYAGTDSTGAYARTITPMPYPTVSSVSTPTGTVAGGTSLTVYGANFLSSCPTGNPSDCPFAMPQVVFGTKYVSATAVDPSYAKLSVTTPVHGAGTFPVKVINPDTRMGTCACTFTFTGDLGLNLTVNRAAGKTHLDWGTNTQLTVQRATDPKFSSGLASWSVTGTGWTDARAASTDGNLYFYKIQ